MRVMTRFQAIGELRHALLALADDEHSMCEVASRHGIYCHGLGRLNDEQLCDRYAWLVRARAPRTREELEDLANRWQLAQQFVHGEELSCDVQTSEQDTCRGWNEFSDVDLERFHREIRHEDVAIASRAPETEHERPECRPQNEPVHVRPKPVRVAAVATRRRQASSHPRPVRPEPAKAMVAVSRRPADVA